LERIPGESLEQEVERLGRAVERLAAEKSALQGEVGAEATAQVSRSLVALREGLIFVRDSRSAAGWQELSPTMARRETVMVEQARSVLTAMPPEEGMVLLGHAAHLAKDWPTARLLQKGAGPPPATMGTQLARAFPGQVFSIWLLHAFGHDSQPIATLPRELVLRRGSLNEALAELGACFLLPLGDPNGLPELLRGEQEIRWIYNAGCRTQIWRQADALFFVREATPLRNEPCLG
jgi:erythromycin esterase-like protein